MRRKQPRDCLDGRLGASVVRAAVRVAVVASLVGASAAPGVCADVVHPAIQARLNGAAGRGLAGLAQDAHGQAVAGVEVRFVPMSVASGAAPILKVLSDERGRFVVDTLAPGLYRLVAVRSGYSVLVGQIDTLLHNTVELILSPAGSPGPPGSRPADASWILRLPHRDVLEDQHEAAPGGAPTPDPRATNTLGAAGSQVVSVEVLRSRVGDSGGASPAGAGNAFALSAALLATDQGLLSGSLARSDEGPAKGLEDRSHSLQFRWVASPLEGKLVTATGDLFQRDSDLERAGAAQAAGRGRLEISGLHVAVSRVAETAARTTGLHVDVALASLDGPRDDAPHEHATSSAARVSAVADVHKRWSPDHETAVQTAVRGVRGTLLAEQGGPSLTLLPRDAAEDRGSLDETTGDGADVAVTDNWKLDPALELSARGGTTWRRGFNDGVRGIAAIGARWAALAALAVRAETGVALGGASAGSELAAAGLEGGGQKWTWSVARGREVGQPAFRAGRAPQRGPDLLLVVADARVDYWTADVRWRGSDGAPDVHLGAARMSVEGALAPRLPGDAAVVPLQAAGAASGQHLELGLSIPASGSSVQIIWESLKDASGARRLLEGAERWDRRAVSLRQHLHRFGARGPDWELIMGAEENRLTSRQPAADDSVRTALLGRRRVSGGMSLTF